MPSPTFLTVLDEMWEGAKFRRIERAFSPPTKGGDTEGESEIMKGLLMAFFLPSTGTCERDSASALHFERSSCVPFLVPAKSLYRVGIPSEPVKKRRNKFFSFMIHFGQV